MSNLIYNTYEIRNKVNPSLTDAQSKLNDLFNEMSSISVPLDFYHAKTVLSYVSSVNSVRVYVNNLKNWCEYSLKKLEYCEENIKASLNSIKEVQIKKRETSVKEV